MSEKICGDISAGAVAGDIDTSRKVRDVREVYRRDSGATRDHENCDGDESRLSAIESARRIYGLMLRIAKIHLTDSPYRVIVTRHRHETPPLAATRKRSLRELHEKPMHDNQSKQTVLNFYSLSP